MSERSQVLINLLEKYSSKKILLEDDDDDENLFRPRRVDTREEELRKEREEAKRKKREKKQQERQANKQRFKDIVGNRKLNLQHFYLVFIKTEKKERYSTQKEYVFLVKTKKVDKIKDLVSNLLHSSYPNIKFLLPEIAHLGTEDDLALDHKGIIASILSPTISKEKEKYIPHKEKELTQKI